MTMPRGDPWLLADGGHVLVLKDGSSSGLKATFAYWNSETLSFSFYGTRNYWKPPTMEQNLTKVMAFTSVMEGKCGLLRPCVLALCTTSCGTTCYFLWLCLEMGFTVHCSFPVSAPLPPSVVLLDGPVAIWYSNGLLQYTLQTFDATEVKVQALHNVEPCWFGTLGGVMTLIGIEQKMAEAKQTSAQPSVDPLTVDREWTVKPISSEDIIPIIDFLPRGYASATRCMSIEASRLKSSAMASEGQGLKHGSQGEPPQVEKTANSGLCTIVFAATSHGQLVRCENGVVTGICELPFRKPHKLMMAVAGAEIGELAVIADVNGHVCAVQTERMQVVGQWEGVFTVLIDDFAKRGTEQILLLFKGPGDTGAFLSRFLLTDLLSIYYSHNAGSRVMETADIFSGENHDRIVTALERRLQAGMSMLQELQDLSSAKEVLTQQSLDSLLRLIHGVAPVLLPPSQVGLVPLLDGAQFELDQLDDKPSICSDISAVAAPPGWVHGVWQRVLGDSWVVGVHLSSEASRKLSDVVLWLGSDSPSQTCCEVLNPKTLCCSEQRAISGFSSSAALPSRSAKRFKTEIQPPGDEASFAEQIWYRCTCPTKGMQPVAVTTLPAMGPRDTARRFVMLHARRSTWQREEAARLVHWYCGEVTLTTEELAAGKYLARIEDPNLSADEQALNIVAHLSVHPRLILTVLAPSESLTGFVPKLEEALRCHPLPASPSWLLCSALSGPLYGTLLHWHTRHADSGCLHIIATNQASLRLAVFSTRAALPPSARFSSHASSSPLARALRTRLVAVRDHVRAAMDAGARSDDGLFEMEQLFDPWIFTDELAVGLASSLQF
uniref:Fanconi anemia group B protein n=1 Tax=Myxine glutinosa TaxID=7769 RepID=UPI0035901507